MRSQDKKRIETCWFIGQTPEQAAEDLKLPLEEVQDIFTKISKKLQLQSTEETYG
ncbi:MAG TPA: hypothetical protein VKP88_05240 [Candidatus Paceibacterota bacterium]|nr:hypothetical protein [Candidatus Paceibacterota bacterium]